MRRMSDYAVYLGDGVWWQISQRDYDHGKFDTLPLMYRKPWRRYQ